MEKGQQCENAKEAYRDQLTKTNNSQTLHYSTNFPQLSDVCYWIVGGNYHWVVRHPFETYFIV